MRKLLMSLTVLAGATIAATNAAHAAHVVILPDVVGVPHVRPVQYVEDWRHREWRRREAWQRWRHHDDWRRWHHYHD